MVIADTTAEKVNSVTASAATLEESYIAYCKVASFVDDERMYDTLIITGIHNFCEAMEKIEDYYGNTLESVNIELQEGPFYFISDTWET